MTAASPASADTVKVALGDVPSVETLAFAIAMERAKDRSVDDEMTAFSKEELGIQAIVSGQAQIGIGTPYLVLQKTSAPIRNVLQVSRLVFFPVADWKYETWQDLNGEPFTLHARGTAPARRRSAHHRRA